MGSPTKPPEGPFEALAETARFWKEQQSPRQNDSLIKMNCFEVKWFLALNYFDEIYSHFETYFLYGLDMSPEVQEIFKPCVFNDLIEYDFLHNRHALAKAIAWTIVTLYQEPHRSQAIVQLEEIYNEFVGNPPMQRLMPANTFDLVALIQRILDTAET